MNTKVKPVPNHCLHVMRKPCTVGSQHVEVKNNLRDNVNSSFSVHDGAGKNIFKKSGRQTACAMYSSHCMHELQFTTTVSYYHEVR